jgi:hypothetical protein
MPKIITFSRQFPTYHPRAGHETFFVEQILNYFQINYSSSEYLENLFEWNMNKLNSGKLTIFDLKNFFSSLKNDVFGRKVHTIRNGQRFSKGDTFQPAVWTGKPYCSVQINFLPPLEIKNVQQIFINPSHEIYLDKKADFFGTFGNGNWSILAKNDGLTSKDFKDWFSKLPFHGQIICYNKEIKY